MFLTYELSVCDNYCTTKYLQMTGNTDTVSVIHVSADVSMWFFEKGLAFYPYSNDGQFKDWNANIRKCFQHTRVFGVRENGKFDWCARNGKQQT